MLLDANPRSTYGYRGSAVLNRPTLGEVRMSLVRVPRQLFRLGFHLVVLGLTWCPAIARATPITMIDNGPSSNRVDMVFLGDGYTASDLSTTYVTHINSMLSHTFSSGQDPYPRYSKFFNVHRVNVASSERGADVPPLNVFRNTALDASYYFLGGPERLLYIDNIKASNALTAGLRGASFGADIRLATVNDVRYGGGGGVYAVYSGADRRAPEIALHELGHSFNSLADEYATDGPLRYTGPEPSEVNVTKDPRGTKWARWLGHSEPSFGVIGSYEGAKYSEFGLFRPSVDSKMRTLDRPFDAIGRERIVLDIYSLVDPLDSWLNNKTLLVNPAQLAVDVVDPDVIHVNWFVNGKLVPGANDETFRLGDFGFGVGRYTVMARAFDTNPDWVRTNLDALEQSITWNVAVTPEPTTLLLFGTTAAGLGLARWRARWRSQTL